MLVGMFAKFELLVGVCTSDTPVQLAPMAEKILNLRGFSNDDGRLMCSVLERGGAVLAVPQFTLYGDPWEGRRPDFRRAMKYEEAQQLFTGFIEELRRAGATRVEQGRFGAHMRVTSENDGPVTIMVDDREQP